jgi:formylmethanofuran--tetrahydromethanopterin N-formyltransferase
MSQVIIEDTFAEAFRSYYTAILITGATEDLARSAAVTSAGFATSALGCGVEAGIESAADESTTPDGRPGVVVQYHIWKKNPKMMYKVLLERIGHCVLTAPTAAAYDSTPKPLASVELGSKLAFFGDGYQREEVVGGRKMTVIPIMGGDFAVEKEVGMAKGVSGGNLWFMGSSAQAATEAARAAVQAIAQVPGTITPFPGGICSSGSKVGATKYKFMINSTNHPYCPTLRGRVEDSQVPEGVESIMEVVINGSSLVRLKRATKAGIAASSDTEGLVKISAGNFGGKLGPFRIDLKDL